MKEAVIRAHARRAFTKAVPAVVVLVLATIPATAWAREGSRGLCVRSGAGCFSTVQAAANAAHPGDVVRVGAGTFGGGIKITKSLKLVGAGATATTIKGGGPVLTIGRRNAKKEPAVSITGVTITGGVTSSNATGVCGPDISNCGPGYAGATALGGGIEVPPGRNGSKGATVTIRDSVITANRVAPTKTVRSVTAACPRGACPFAQAAGAGIDNWGTMTLTNTTVSQNEVAGAVTAQADGGGIVSEAGSRLTLNHAAVTENRATVAPPNGRFAAGGGIFVDARATLVIRDSVVSNNSASLSSTYPYSVGDMNAHAGGINVGDGGSAAIDNTTISRNTVTVTDLGGQPVGFDPGIIVGRSPLVLRNSTVSDNSLIVTVGTSAEGGSGGGLEADGYALISNTHVSGNSVSVTSPAGVAEAPTVVNMFDGAAQTAVLRDSVISGNSVKASSTTGSATILGVGLANNGPLQLLNVQVSDNVGTATGPAGFARGGGIFNGLVFAHPTPALTLRNTTVTRNSLTASPGLTVQGGGLFTSFPVTLDNSPMTQNAPDQCYGC